MSDKPKPRYFVLSATWMPSEPGGPWQVMMPGQTVEYDGLPGSSLTPLNAEAVERVRHGRPHAEKMQRRFRASLGRHLAARLAAAEAEMRKSA